MSDVPQEDDIRTRAELLPEEQTAGSEDPEGQAEAILEESEERTADPSGTRKRVDPDARDGVRDDRPLR